MIEKDKNKNKNKRKYRLVIQKSERFSSRKKYSEFIDLSYKNPICPPLPTTEEVFLCTMVTSKVKLTPNIWNTLYHLPSIMNLHILTVTAPQTYISSLPTCDCMAYQPSHQSIFPLISLNILPFTEPWMWVCEGFLLNMSDHAMEATCCFGSHWLAPWQDDTYREGSTCRYIWKINKIEKKRSLLPIFNCCPPNCHSWTTGV